LTIAASSFSARRSPPGDSDLAEEILAEELGLEPDYLIDLLL